MDEGSTMDPVDIFSGSLETLFDHHPITLASAGAWYTYERQVAGKPEFDDPNTITKITITLVVPDTSAANWSLHASDLWASSRYLADHLDRLAIDRHYFEYNDRKVRILELGAAAGLPGILISKVYHNVSVVVSDYPDELLMETLRKNVLRNGVSEHCKALPYVWGSTPSTLSDEGIGFDIVLAADTLWNPAFHAEFMKSLQLTLKKSPSARAHLVAGLHTGRHTIHSFLKNVGKAGFEVESVIESELKGPGERAFDVCRRDDDNERRKWVIWVIMKWRL